MTRDKILTDVRSAIGRERLRWSQHALARMMERGIRIDAVLTALDQGEAIEFYKEDAPFPSLLVAHIEKSPLHVLVAFDSELEEAHVVTVYRPDTTHFEVDLKTRRSSL